MGIMFGNLSIDEMQFRAGVAFPAELVEWMKDRRQEKCSNIEPGKWHCFDAPFMIVCGDMQTAEKIYGHLKPITRDFAVKMQISVQ